jgi:predicted RNase H-like HicB family nuclease
MPAGASLPWPTWCPIESAACGPWGKRIVPRQLTAIIEREGTGYVALCPELDIASQGDSIEEARSNLREALELFFEAASPEELRARLHEEVYVTRLEIGVG